MVIENFGVEVLVEAANGKDKDGMYLWGLRALKRYKCTGTYSP